MTGTNVLLQYEQGICKYHVQYMCFLFTLSHFIQVFVKLHLPRHVTG